MTSRSGGGVDNFNVYRTNPIVIYSNIKRWRAGSQLCDVIYVKLLLVILTSLELNLKALVSKKNKRLCTKIHRQNNGRRKWQGKYFEY